MCVRGFQVMTVPSAGALGVRECGHHSGAITPGGRRAPSGHGMKLIGTTRPWRAIEWMRARHNYSET